MDAKAGFLYYTLVATLGLFVVAAILLGEVLKAYDAMWWWDDMLHGVSGVLLGLVGLLSVYALNARHGMKISPLLIAVFVFCFAMAVSVLWELFEFGMDYFFATTMQQWNMSSHAIVIGKDYQGIGLRDTMGDFILTFIGAFGVAVFSYFTYKNKREMVIRVMRRAFPWVKPH